MGGEGDWEGRACMCSGVAVTVGRLYKTQGKLFGTPFGTGGKDAHGICCGGGYEAAGGSQEVDNCPIVEGGQGPEWLLSQVG